MQFWRQECAAASRSQSSSQFIASAPHPPADLLLFQLAAQVRCDPQLGGVPEPIHFMGEVFGELGRVNGEQGLVVGVSSGGRPIERSCDHCFVVDDSELVMQLCDY